MNICIDNEYMYRYKVTFIYRYANLVVWKTLKAALLIFLRIKCVRSNRYTGWKLADMVEKLNVNKHLFCV